MVMEDVFNIYAVHFGHRPGALITDHAYLAHALKLSLNPGLVHRDHSGARAKAATLVTRRAVSKKTVGERELGDLLGYFCSAHRFWKENVPRIQVHIRFKIGRHFCVPFPMMCEDSQITAKNAKAFIASLERVRVGYAKVAKHLATFMALEAVTEPKIVLTVLGAKTRRVMTPKQFLANKFTT